MLKTIFIFRIWIPNVGPHVELKEMDFGPGIGAVSSNGGVLICGGENNVMTGPDDMSGGKVSMNNSYTYIFRPGK